MHPGVPKMQWLTLRVVDGALDVVGLSQHGVDVLSSTWHDAYVWAISSSSERLCS